MMESWEQALAIANGKAALTGRRHWVWRGKATGLWRVTALEAPLGPVVVEQCS